MKHFLSLSAAAAFGLAGAAYAQTTVVTTPSEPVVVMQPPVQATEVQTDSETSGGGAIGGATTGAVAGAMVGGPVGAAVGGLAGAVVGDATEDAVTPDQRTYVMENRVQSVTVDGLAVGTTIPQTVQVQPIPQSQYQYVYVDDQPVIVDPATRKVIYIVK